MTADRRDDAEPLDVDAPRTGFPGDAGGDVAVAAEAAARAAARAHSAGTGVGRAKSPADGGVRANSGGRCQSPLERP